MSETTVFNIFMAYAREDKTYKEMLYRQLRPLEISKVVDKVWHDGEIIAGQLWDFEIKAQIDKAQIILLLISSDFLNSDYAMNEEYTRALKRHQNNQATVIPIIVDHCYWKILFELQKFQIPNADKPLADYKGSELNKLYTQIIEAIDIAIQLRKKGNAIPLSTPVPSVVAPTKATTIPPNFIRIPGGTFTMGSPEKEVDRQNDETQHQVKLSDFYMCQYTVTLAEFKKFIEQSGYQTDADRDGGSYIWKNSKWEKTAGVNWRCGVDGKERPAQEWNHPVLHVSWNDCIAYCNHLSWQYDSPLSYDQHGNLLDVQGKTTPDLKQVKGFRLPTEAEWEYACRCNAPTPMPFYTGLNLRTDQANYDGNYPYNNHSKGEYRANTVPVDHFEPNKWKLYNMHGNIFEWCYDWYDAKYYDTCKAKGVVENPIGPASASNRVLRGGSWDTYARSCRSAYRGSYTPAFRSHYRGFRVVFVPQFII